MAPLYLCNVTQMIPTAPSARGLAYAAFAASAAFGSFWGVWGASIPRIRAQTGLDDAQLGVALLFVGAGALPAMLLAGRALDRWGHRFAVAVVVALGLSGIGVALTATGFVSLSAGLAIVGATSGATDVAMNSVAGRAEQLSGKPVITRAGGVFSTFVVLASLGTGASSTASAPTSLPFAIVAALSLVAGALILRSLPVDRAPADEHVDLEALTSPVTMRLAPLLLIGALGALAFASENAHQSWGAVFLEDELGSGPGTSAIAPAVFAGVVAITRFSNGAINPAHARRVLVAGAITAAGGAVLVSISGSIPVAILGLIIAAAGTAALYPTLLSIVSRNVRETYRGRATSIVTIASYLGFLLGPVYVGVWSEHAGLRGAMLAVGALGLALAVLTAPLLHLSGMAIHRQAQPTPDTCDEAPKTLVP